MTVLVRSMKDEYRTAVYYSDVLSSFHFRRENVKWPNLMAVYEFITVPDLSQETLDKIHKAIGYNFRVVDFDLNIGVSESGATRKIKCIDIFDLEQED